MNMNLSMPPGTQSSNDLAALRRVIAELSERCCLDLADSSVVRRLMDGDLPHRQGLTPDSQTFQDLRAMLILLFRLESSCSEDLGIAGLRTLWCRHREILARFQVGEAEQGGPQLAFTAQ
ncbi:hypothetical protein [Rhodoferax sp.]|uniref:hypothetical protein n=1 Tax=Rhodoferax sp. TaxID=50421 RepID=UPI00271D1E19|nr:hypothetical protein [Rhodoferax sp.]MDO9197687.1 hypothetical protein [Rhodoferax sp.]